MNVVYPEHSGSHCGAGAAENKKTNRIKTDAARNVKAVQELLIGSPVKVRHRRCEQKCKSAG